MKARKARAKGPTQAQRIAALEAEVASMRVTIGTMLARPPLSAPPAPVIQPRPDLWPWFPQPVVGAIV